MFIGYCSEKMMNKSQIAIYEGGTSPTPYLNSPGYLVGKHMCLTPFARHLMTAGDASLFSSNRGLFTPIVNFETVLASRALVSIGEYERGVPIIFVIFRSTYQKVMTGINICVPLWTKVDLCVLDHSLG